MILVEIIKQCVRFYDKIKMVIADYFLSKHFKEVACFNVLDSYETVKLIKEKQLSVSRYGDGEFSVMLGGGNGFQTPNKNLQKRLIEVMSYRGDKLLLCIPYALVSTSGLKFDASYFWHNYMYKKGKQLKPIVDSNYLYGNASFTRFYIDYRDKSDCESLFKNIKSLWQDRDIVIIEGDHTCMGVGNDIFDNVNSLRRIICPSKDAFSKYDNIKNAALEHISKDHLVLIALGMTATVLAYDLMKEGYQAIDIGHLDIEYEWMRMGATRKCAISGKAVNEVGHNPMTKSQDKEYLESIMLNLTL